jgi:DNA-binding NarL/FixJ family response regulator
MLILSGKTNTEISDTLGKSKRTIETHRFNLMKKMNVKNLIELSSKAKELGFS